MTSLDLLRKRNLTSHQLRCLADRTGSALVAAEADAQAVVERIREGPRPVAIREGLIAANPLNGFLVLGEEWPS